MPKIKVLFYQDEDASVPVLNWLKGLPTKAAAKCFVKMERLAELGHELRRPEADLLRDKIYELRIGLQGINYRILYFYHGTVAAMLAHGITKEREVPSQEINKALERKRKFELNPEKHTSLKINL
ncbi:MAG: hypothetical protein A3F67_03790 [Verrucomicrobia bacterium RIFCSPHIGHO2_12_FULL_41_10]|nr:MAG: hypothetical protein A3F67_03790 [Verrucomicrobia bacterium RIFCSPHIGHO2_12_FULL_41_10]HLB33503.1 type II toxin-antitoxin system RelE/ParE family toxin [Chthoniobacterales bacterium]